MHTHIYLTLKLVLVISIGSWNLDLIILSVTHMFLIIFTLRVKSNFVWTLLSYFLLNQFLYPVPFLKNLSGIFRQIDSLRNKFYINLNWLFLDYLPLEMILRCSRENVMFGGDTSWDVSDSYFWNSSGFNFFIIFLRELLWLHLWLQ